MFYLKKCFILFVVILLQNSVVPLVAVKGIMPDLVLIYLVHISSWRNRHQGVMLGFLGGLFQDLAGGGMLGIGSLSYTIAVFVSGSFPWNRFDKSLLLLGSALAAASVSQHVIKMVFLFRSSDAGFYHLILRYAIPSIGYTCTVGVLLYFLFMQFNTRRQTLVVR